jgi:phenylacetate-CoA ligase
MRRLRGNLTIMAHLRGQTRVPFLPAERIAGLRDARIRRIVAHAGRTVPYYRDLFARERIDPREIRGAKDLDALPLLDPDVLRADPTLFLSRSHRARDSFGSYTSGSIGEPLEIRHDRRSLLANIAYGERERGPVIDLCGGSFRPRELRIDHEASNTRRVLDYYAANTRLPVKPRREWAPVTAPFEEIVAAINASRPDLLTAHGGFLDAFFRTLVAREAEIHPPKVVMYAGETLSTERRDWIERELGARVMSRYCAAESFKIGYFCEEQTGFHLHDDLCRVRVLREDARDARPGEPGEVVISNLVNYATVLLNYRIGDSAELSSQACPCGRQHRLLSEIHGRRGEMLPLANGRRLHPRALWSTFQADPRVLQYQLVQHAPRRFELRLATVDEASFPQSRDRAIRELRPLLGSDAEIEASHHPGLGRVERKRTGKFPVIESRLPKTAAGALA